METLTGLEFDHAFVFSPLQRNVGPGAKEHSFIRILVETVADSSISTGEEKLAPLEEDVATTTDDFFFPRPGAGAGSYEFQKPALEVRTPLFKRFLDNNQQREMQALYALQHLMHKLEHPNSESD